MDMELSSVNMLTTFLCMNELDTPKWKAFCAKWQHFLSLFGVSVNS